MLFKLAMVCSKLWNMKLFANEELEKMYSIKEEVNYWNLQQQTPNDRSK